MSLFLPSAAAGSTVVLVTLNFTITNMDYTEEMGNSGSLKFNSTERILQRQVRAFSWPSSYHLTAGLITSSTVLANLSSQQLKFLLNKTTVGPLYTGCRLAALR